MAAAKKGSQPPKPSAGTPPQPPVGQVEKSDKPTNPPESAKTEKALSVQSSRDGFRRAGRAWGKEATVVALSELTQEQIEQIRNEEMLTVAEVEIPAESAAE